MTYVSTHTANKNDAALSLRLEHMLCSLASAEEGTVHVDIVKLANAIRGVTGREEENKC